MTTAIVVDSAAALPASLVERLHVEVVPMHVVIDGQDRTDDEVTTAELLTRLGDASVTTSAPSPVEWADGINRALAVADDAVVLTVSAEMSATHRTAELAVGLVNGPVRVIDTRTAAGGEALVAIAAAREAEHGGDADAVVQAAARAIGAVHLTATLDNLDRLVASGRVPQVANTAVRTLRFNPVFEFRDGSAKPLHPAIGRRAAEHRIVRGCVTSRPRDGGPARLRAAVLESGCPDRARALRRELEDEVPDVDLFLSSFSSVMAAHVGRGLLGLAWWWDRDRGPSVDPTPG